ncbi:MAG: nucleotide sugar dehydrogenase [bacterium]|nr:nucleotide sugar dehydrogenase [bacterium]
MDIKKKISEKKCRVGIIGLGYVGLPLAVEFAQSGFHVTGFDVNSGKVASVNKGNSYIEDITSNELKKITNGKLLKATNDFSELKNIDAVVICVPTPLRKTRDPDLSYIIESAERIAEHLHKGQLIVLESTTYPGTCEEVIMPILENKGFKTGRDFYLAFSPERVDPGNKRFRTRDIPKVIGGYTEKCAQVAILLYKQVIVEIIPVSSIRVAEMVKLLENTYRAVNIGLVNEIAMMCDRMGINVWEVIEGAASKPFGFTPFLPGPGIGGHCLPIDPLYLSWKAKSYNFEARFIELASQINSFMPHHVINKLLEILNVAGKCLKNSRILVMGVAYKKNVGDTRESPALDILEKLFIAGAKLSYCDPYVPKIANEKIKISNSSLTKKLVASSDCVLILTDHDCFDLNLILKHSKLVFDTRNALKVIPRQYRGKVVKL